MKFQKNILLIFFIHQINVVFLTMTTKTIYEKYQNCEINVGIPSVEEIGLGPLVFPNDDQSCTLQAGNPSEQKVTYTIKLKNGSETSTTVDSILDITTIPGGSQQTILSGNIESGFAKNGYVVNTKTFPSTALADCGTDKGLEKISTNVVLFIIAVVPIKLQLILPIINVDVLDLLALKATLPLGSTICTLGNATNLFNPGVKFN